MKKLTCAFIIMLLGLGLFLSSCDKEQGTTPSLTTEQSIEAPDTTKKPSNNSEKEVLVYTDHGEYYSVKAKGTVRQAELVIPDTYNGKPVKEIEKVGFLSQQYVESLVIPYSIQVVGRSAFKGCTKLEKITFGTGLKVIGAEAFADCAVLEQAVFPEGLKTIEEKAFSGCKSLSYVSFPSTLEPLGGFAFKNCNITGINVPNVDLWLTLNYSSTIGATLFVNGERVTKIVIPEGTTVYRGIGPLVGIEDVVLPKGIEEIRGKIVGASDELILPSTVKVIGEGAFYGSDFKKIVLPEGLRTIEKDAFKSSSIESIVIPSSVSLSKSGIFFGCKSLRRVEFKGEKTGTEIPVYTFSYCESLEEVILPKNLNKIDREAFRDCTSLKSIDIPQSVRVIGEKAFYECTSLESVNIPEKLTIMGGSAFYNCVSLKGELVIPATLVNLGSGSYGEVNFKFRMHKDNELFVSDGKAIVEKKSQTLLAAIGDHIPTALKFTAIGDYLYKEQVFHDTIVIPTGVEYIGYHAFGNAEFAHDVKNKAVIIPEGVKEISDHAFYYIDYEYILIPSTTEAIGENALSRDPLSGGYDVILYNGNDEGWAKIKIIDQRGVEAEHFENERRLSVHIFSEKKPTVHDNFYWHYDENGDPAIWE